MSIFRNIVLNFKSEDDCQNYITRYKEYIPTFKGQGLEKLVICRLTPDSILVFTVIDSEENAQKMIEKASEWRELNRFEFQDQMVLDGSVEGEWDFTK